MGDMVALIAMGLDPHRNTNVRKHLKPNAIQLHVLCLQSIAKIGKRKYVKSSLKKYVYTKQCRPVPKTVCDNADQMSLVPSCVPSSRKECSYHPRERCENVPKQHCYQIPYQVKKMECTEGGYDQPAEYDSQNEDSGY